MMTRLRRWAWTGLCVAALSGVGCDLASLSYFLAGAPEPKVDAKLKALAGTDKKKAVKVAVLTASGVNFREEFIGAEREIGANLTKHLERLCKANDENVKVIQARKVDEYKNNHPDWKLADQHDIGKDLGVDYVVFLEINSLGLYEQGSANTLYRGNARMSVSVFDVKNTDDTVTNVPFRATYPKAELPGVPAGFDAHPVEFRRAFLDNVGQQLAWLFTSHATREDFYAGSISP